MYYLTKTGLAKKHGFCHTWNQTTAKQEANEIGSCLYFHGSKYLKDLEWITLFGDNCPGQNKYRYMMISLWCQMMSLFNILMKNLRDQINLYKKRSLRMRITVCIPQMDVQREINKTIFHLYQ